MAMRSNLTILSFYEMKPDIFSDNDHKPQSIRHVNRFPACYTKKTEEVLQKVIKPGRGNLVVLAIQRNVQFRQIYSPPADTKSTTILSLVQQFNASKRSRSFFRSLLGKFTI